jgi:hypothetical protein
MSNRLYQDLPSEEQTPEESIYTVGDSLLMQFYCGNWSATVEEMTENNYTVKELSEYIKNQEEEFGCIGGWLDWFDREFFAELGGTAVKLN